MSTSDCPACYMRGFICLSANWPNEELFLSSPRKSACDLNLNTESIQREASATLHRASVS